MLVRPYGMTPDGAAVESTRLGKRHAAARAGHHLWRHDRRARNAGPQGRPRQCRPLAAVARGLYRARRLSGRDDRALRQSHRWRLVRARRPHISGVENEGDNCLHGGRIGFNKAVWTRRRVPPTAPEPRLTLRHVSPDGDQGFPGAVALEVTYVVIGGTCCGSSYRAETDHPTVINFTNHAYFNLSGGSEYRHSGARGDDRSRALHAGRCQSIPTGEMRDVAGTPFDFRSRTRSARASASKTSNSVSAAWLRPQFRSRPGRERRTALAARARDPHSGRVLDVHTTQPGVQFYSGNNLDGTLRGPDGEVYGRNAALPLKRSTFRIRRTGRPFRSRCCRRARSSPARRNTASASTECADGCDRAAMPRARGDRRGEAPRHRWSATG